MKILLYGDVLSALDKGQAALIASVDEMPQGRASDMGMVATLAGKAGKVGKYGVFQELAGKAGK